MSEKDMRRMRKERMEWEAAQTSRFEELDTDDDDEDYDDDGVENIRLAPNEAYRDDVLQYPEQAGRYSRRDARDDDHLAYPTDYDYAEGYDENFDYRSFDAGGSGGGDMQLALRQKEEELVDNALRRIRRARIRGDPDVGLSREEIDALERRQLIPRPSDAPARGGQTTAIAPAAPKTAKPKKRSGGGFLGFGSATQRPKSARSSDRRLTPPVEPRPLSSRAPPPDSTYYAAGPSPPPVQQPYGASSGHRSNSSPSKYPSSSSSSRPNSRRQMIEQPPPFALRPQSSSSRGSPTRSLPDDPDWVPRSHSGSPAHHYHQGGGAPVDPFMYQTSASPQHIQGRRITSGPPTVSYSSLRRAPPPSNSVGRTPSGSGLSQEIPISSDESRDGADEEDEEEEEESDDGVTLDVSKVDARMAAQSSRQTMPPPPLALAAPPSYQRSRRGRR